jgi:hypothetical protein
MRLKTSCKEGTEETFHKDKPVNCIVYFFVISDSLSEHLEALQGKVTLHVLP